MTLRSKNSSSLRQEITIDLVVKHLFEMDDRFVMTQQPVDMRNMKIQKYMAMNNTQCIHVEIDHSH